VERHIHVLLTDDRKRGEWFELPMDEPRLGMLVAQAIQHLASEEEMKIRRIAAERILLLRRRKGWTQPELAREAGMGITTLNRVENAHASMTMEKVVALAQILGTSADYLLGLTEEPTTERPARPAQRARPRQPALQGT